MKTNMAVTGCTFSAFVRLMSSIVPYNQKGYDIVDEGTNMRAHYNRTGFVPVVEFEGVLPDVFDTLDAYYQFQAWVTSSKLRAQTHYGFGVNAFDVIKYDIAEHRVNIDPAFLTIIDGLVNAQEEYADKFRHHPVNLHNFIKEFATHGRAAVLADDIY